MYFKDLFENEKSSRLKRANILVSKLKQRIIEAKTLAPQRISALKEWQKDVLEYIEFINNPNRFVEDHVQDVESFIIDMVISLRARGLSSFSLSKLEKELIENGVEVDSEFLVDYLANLDGIQEVNPGEDEVVFNTSVDRGVSDDEAAKEKDQIKKSAAKVANDTLDKKNDVPTVEIK